MTQQEITAAIVAQVELWQKLGWLDYLPGFNGGHVTMKFFNGNWHIADESNVIEELKSKISELSKLIETGGL